MPGEEINGKNMAILSTKLDNIASNQKDMKDVLEALRAAASTRDKQLVALETQMEDIIWYKRAVILQILGTLAAIAIAVFSIFAN